MARLLGRWVELFRSFGQALLEVLEAEFALLGREMGDSARSLGVALAFFAVAGFLLFWTLGVLTLAGFEVLSLWMSRWGAALTMAAVLLVVMAAALALGWWRLRRIENPLQTLRRRTGEHAAWWQESLLEEREGGRRRPGER